jgi:hypothetical protein
MAGRAAPRLSGLQRSVLALYRQCLRAAYAKPPVSPSLSRALSLSLSLTHTHTHALTPILSLTLLAALYWCCQEAQAAFRAYARAKFKQGARLERSNVMQIEYLLRQGKKQLQLLQQPSVTTLHPTFLNPS